MWSSSCPVVPAPLLPHHTLHLPLCLPSGAHPSPLCRSGLLSEARALLEESCASSEAVQAATPEQRAALLQSASAGGRASAEPLSHVHRLALRYNCARLQEAMGDMAAAAAGYEVWGARMRLWGTSAVSLGVQTNLFCWQ